MPIAWRGTVIQYAGRLHRRHPDKPDVVINDYVDAELPVLYRMFAERLRTYRSLGYELAEAPMSRRTHSSYVAIRRGWFRRCSSPSFCTRR